MLQILPGTFNDILWLEVLFEKSLFFFFLSLSFLLKSSFGKYFVNVFHVVIYGCLDRINFVMLIVKRSYRIPKHRVS